MALKTKKSEMIEGPLWGKILKFAAFYLLTAFLQKFYNAADVMVVGKFAGHQALAGVGTCTTIVNLFINFILGLSAGATIVLGQAIGAGNREGISKAAHTAVAVAVCGGLTISLVCTLFTKSLLGLVGVPEDVMPYAEVYLRIIALGFVPALVYNFGAAILRSKGDTKRALYIVSVSGIINVGLNLLFVCVFKMEAGGVALATIISQLFSAAAIMYILSREPDEVRISLNKIRIYKEPFVKMLKFGLPSGVQSSVFSLSNMLVQSSINSFGAAAMAGSAAESSIAAFYNEMGNSLYHSSLVFVSQNYGARKFDRIKKVIGICFTYVFAAWVLQSFITFFFGEELIGLYTNDNAALIMGLRKFNIIGYSYIAHAIMVVMSGALRGMGASFFNMIMSILGVCGIRIIWILTVFKQIGTFESLFACYPVSWAGTVIFYLIMFVIVYKRAKRHA